MALITDTEYKAYRGISGSALDAQLAVLIPIAQARIESLCGRPAGGFEEAEWTQDYDGHGGPYLPLKCWPVTEVDSVSWRSPDGTLTALTSTCYWIDPEARGIQRAGATVGRGLGDPNTLDDDTRHTTTGWGPAFYEGLKNYRVVYTGGYESDEIPPELQMAMFKMLDQMLADTGQPGDLKSESDGHYSYTKSDKGFAGDPSDPLSIASLLSNWTTPI